MFARKEWIEIEARFASDQDARGYALQPMLLPLSRVDSIGGDALCTIKMDVQSSGEPTIYVCERPSYEEVARIVNAYRLTSWWRRFWLFLMGR